MNLNVDNDKVIFEEKVYQYLPDEIFVEVLRFLDADDIFITIKKINKRFNTLVKEEVIWKHLCHAKMRYCKDINLQELLKNESNNGLWMNLFFSFCNWVVRNKDFYVRPGQVLGPRVRRRGKFEKFKSILVDRIYTHGKHSFVLHYHCIPTYRKLFEQKKYRKGKSKKVSIKIPSFGSLCVGFVIFNEEDLYPEDILNQNGFCRIGFNTECSRGIILDLANFKNKPTRNQYNNNNSNKGKKKKQQKYEIIKGEEWIIKVEVDLDLSTTLVLIKKLPEENFRKISKADFFQHEFGKTFRGISFGISLKYSSDTVTLISCI